MCSISSFAEVLEVLGRLEGKLVEAADSSLALYVSGVFSREPDMPDLDIVGLQAERAVMFRVGENGRLALFASDFQSAEWDEGQHVLALETEQGAIRVSEVLWNK